MRRSHLFAVSVAVLAFASLDAGAQQTGTSDCAPSRRVRCPTSAEIVAAANAQARQAPSAERFIGARQVYSYAQGALYELHASPNYVSSVLLEPGEVVTGIAAGDTSRWMVSEAEAEGDGEPRSIILVKPQTAGLATNIVIVTDRRTYVVEARASSGDRYSAEIAWTYPDRANADFGPAIESVNFGYRVRTIRGRTPRWTPTLIFDDGRRTWIEFPPDVAAADLPPLFIITPEGAELVNYRVHGRRYLVDRVFDAAELRFGVRAPVVVRIDRGAEPRVRQRRGGRP
jgi:type IV secretion system protein TrbG